MQTLKEWPRGLAWLALLQGNFACSVSWLSGHMAAAMIDLAARN